MRILVIRPILPARLTRAWICPLPCGGICQGLAGRLAVAQWQSARTLSMTISFVQTLVKLKVNGASCSPGEGSYRLVSASNTSVGMFVTVWIWPCAGWLVSGGADGCPASGATPRLASIKPATTTALSRHLIGGESNMGRG